MSINLVVLSGNLGADAESKPTKDGGVWTKFSIAVNKYSSGKEPETMWFDVVSFKQTAEYSAHLKKGDHVVVHGELQIDKVEGEADTRYFTKIIARQVEGPKEAAMAMTQARGGNTSTTTTTSGGKPTTEDMPF